MKKTLDHFEARGISPVIGAVLLIGIAAILASVALTLVMGLSAPSTHTGEVSVVENAELGQIEVNVEDRGNAQQFRIVSDTEEKFISSNDDSVTVTASESVYVISVKESGDEELIQTYEPQDVTLVNAEPINPPADCSTIIADTAGDGSSGDPHQITDVQELQCVKHDTTANYIQTEDINAHATNSWYGGDGFVPIGDSSEAFTGTYDGQGYSIDGLTMRHGGMTHIGLFANVNGGELSNMHITDIDITGSEYVGGAIGHIESGTVENVNTDGSVEGYLKTGGVIGRANGSTVVDSNADTDVDVNHWHGGGLIGYMPPGTSGEVVNSHATGDVSVEHHYAGGLIGEAEENTWVIRDSTAEGEVRGREYVGGLAGKTYHTIENSSAHGDVILEHNPSTPQNRWGGGLGGYLAGNVSESYATGDVSGGTKYTGGLMGKATRAGLSPMTINDSYATGDVEGENFVGGLVGYTHAAAYRTYAEGDVTATGDEAAGGLIGYIDANSHVGHVEDSYATGDVEGGDKVGGLIGQQHTGNLTNGYAAGTVTSDADNGGGLVQFTRGSIEAGYWNTETSIDDGGDWQATGLTTAEMQGTAAEDNMDFDFGDTWETTTSPDGYPVLHWQR